MSRLSRLLSLCLAVCTLGCDDLSARDEDAAPDAAIAAPGMDDAEPTATTPEERTTRIDASKEGAWTYLDLDRGAQGADEAALPGWDLALSRFDVKLNGGVSGSGGVQASVLQGVDFATLREAPAAGWGSDRADGDDDDEKPEYFVSAGETGWWDYDADSHKLTPRPHVYVVRSDEGSFYKLVVRNYYNDAGSSGYPLLAWAKVSEPAGPLGARDAAVDVTTRASEAAHDAGAANGG